MELINKRNENSKTFDLGSSKQALDVHIGAIHYKDDYTNKSELWKDIDLTWEGNRITRVPYELTLEGSKITVRDKKTGEVSTIELIETQPAGIEWEIIPENTRVRFRHILSPDKVPFQARFRVTGKIPLSARVFDNEGELELDTSLIDGILTEKLSEVKDKETGQVRIAKGNIGIDPTLDLQVVASADDIHIWWNGSAWQAPVTPLTHVAQNVGYTSATALKYGCGMRFQNVNVPKNATIDTAYLIMTARLARTNNDVNTVIIGEDVDDAAVFSDLADYQARRGTIVGGANDDYITSASVDWLAIPAWSVDEEGADTTSPEIKTIIQEIVDRGSWASGNALVLFWDDHAGNSTAAANTLRGAYSYDGSSTKCAKLHIEYAAVVTGAQYVKIDPFGVTIFGGRTN